MMKNQVEMMMIIMMKRWMKMSSHQVMKRCSKKQVCVDSQSTLYYCSLWTELIFHPLSFLTDTLREKQKKGKKKTAGTVSMDGFSELLLLFMVWTDYFCVFWCSGALLSVVLLLSLPAWSVLWRRLSVWWEPHLPGYESVQTFTEGEFQKFGSGIYFLNKLILLLSKD